MDVKIEKLVYGGDGLGHHDGHTVFVPFVLPGEVVRIRPVERKKKFIRGQALEIVEPAAGRAAAPCPHFTVCGGCHYQHIPYEEQLRLKSEILRETLRRLGRVEWPGEIQMHPSPPLGYRNRAQWKARPVANGQSLGYFRAASNALCAVDECPILAPPLAETLQALRKLAGAGKLPASLREIEAFTNDDGTRLLLNASLVSFDAGPATFAETLRGALPGLESILLHESSRDRYELLGPGFIHYGVAGASYRVGHMSFFQANRFLLDEMVRVVTTGAKGRLVFDLFAGVGLFSVPLARQFERVYAVETNPAAGRDLTENLKGFEASAQAVNADVEEFLARQDETPDLVLLDPPRAGVAPEALKRLIALAPPAITYVSCDPATLARDLASLASAGYSMAEFHLFDLFPQTFHIESVVRLARQP